MKKNIAIGLLRVGLLLQKGFSCREKSLVFCNSHSLLLKCAKMKIPHTHEESTPLYTE
ncbi:hypothetical protein [Legionella maceachernii]|uniref:Uncharacterized protein n=1 Tax=Legionella maceachernii TaxID=466 RepID=A0A0W0VXH0_9GAMM|nr:hypothetical protein [Legionella maceachernii]KTD24406.1 hypothetical protein Lmac_2493 [Legionella maceachernii]SJZ67592.1 hypothetical protein SAMN02745128_00740 [Legionella maceachernii]SUP02070.1 Uncharacterised protein [Legionella maceachernii]